MVINIFMTAKTVIFMMMARMTIRRVVSVMSDEDLRDTFNGYLSHIASWSCTYCTVAEISVCISSKYPLKYFNLKSFRLLISHFIMYNITFYYEWLAKFQPDFYKNS